MFLNKQNELMYADPFDARVSVGSSNENKNKLIVQENRQNETMFESEISED